MNATEFTAALNTLGLTQGAAANVLGYNIRSVNSFATGERSIPVTVAMAVQFLMQKEEQGK